MSDKNEELPEGVENVYEIRITRQVIDAFVWLFNSGYYSHFEDVEIVAVHDEYESDTIKELIVMAKAKGADEYHVVDSIQLNRVS